MEGRSSSSNLPILGTPGSRNPGCDPSSLRLDQQPGRESLAPLPDIDSKNLQSIADSLDSLAESAKRIADHLDPPPPDVVDSGYVASRLGCTKVWIASLARSGELPANCIVPGTGNGKPWRFYRSRIDAWLQKR